MWRLQGSYPIHVSCENGPNQSTKNGKIYSMEYTYFTNTFFEIFRFISPDVHLLCVQIYCSRANKQNRHETAET